MVLRATTWAQAKREMARAKERKAMRKAKRKTIFSGKPQAFDRTALRAKLDSLWAFYVKLRDRLYWGGKCRIQKADGCLGVGQVAYHLVPRGRSDATRWHPSNGVAACSPCNMGEKENRLTYARHHEKLFGREEMNWLHDLAEKGAKMSRQDLLDKAVELRGLIEGLRPGGRLL